MTPEAPIALALSPQDRERVERVEALARGGRAAMGQLLALLDDPSWAVRRAVVAALARAGGDALPGLCEILQSRREVEARLAAAVDAIAASSADVTETLLALAGDDAAPPLLCDVLQVLGRRKESAALPRMIRLASHPDDNVAVAAIEAMARTGGIDTVEPLLAAVRAKNFFRTFPAIDALGRTGDPRAIAPLVALLDDPFYAAEATRALGRTGQEAAIGALGALLTRSSDALVRTACSALSDLCDLKETRYGDPGSMSAPLRAATSPARASARVVEATAGAVHSEQVAAVRVLGWLGDETGIVQLFEFLGREDPLAQPAAAALREMGAEAAPFLTQALRDGGSLLRARVLPIVGVGKNVVEGIVQCLDDEDASVRARACEALARAGNTSVVPALFRLIGDPDSRVSQAAGGAIQSLGSTETKRLALEECRSSTPRVRRAALRIVAYFGYIEGLDVLIGALHDDDERIRETAIQGLPLVDHPKALEALLAATKHASPKTRAAALRGLGQGAATPRVVAALEAGIADEDPWVRYYACQSIAKRRLGVETDRIVQLIDDPAGQVRVAAVEALAYLDTPAAFSALARAAAHDDPDIRRAAIVGLGIARRAEALPLLRDAVTSPDPATRLVAVSAIGEFEAAEVVPVLAHAASDPHDGVRGAAIGVLATRSGETATKALVDLVRDAALRERAIAALAVNIEGRTETILGALEHAPHDLATALVAALVRMRRPSGFAALAAVLSFDSVVARRAAAAALAALGTKEANDALRTYAAIDLDPEVRRIGAAAPA